MASRSLRSRLQDYYQRRAASLLFKRPFLINPQTPLISFTFDDFPRSALLAGGAILNRFDLAGTYYASLGLAGQEAPCGRLFIADDLKTLFEGGHELGSHTFSHCDSWQTETEVFENSVVENSAALSRLHPGAEFKSFSYPISLPRPRTKAKIAGYFLCCRAGGQTLNTGSVDLNQLSAFFLEKSRNNIQAIKDLIDRNRQVRGWLIFATHDVSDTHSPLGCSPEFFEQVVRYAMSSGARILPVVKALEALGAPGRGSDSTQMYRVATAPRPLQPRARQGSGAAGSSFRVDSRAASTSVAIDAQVEIRDPRVAEHPVSGRDGLIRQPGVVEPGALNGVTIMRYAHIQRHRASGGVEQYLWHLDHGLLQKHRMTVLQMHLVKDDADDAIEVENVGLGRILWVPIVIRQRESRLTDLPKQMSYVYRRTSKLYQQEGKGQYSAMLASALSLLHHRGGHLWYKGTILSDRLLSLLVTHRVDLLAMHWLSYDAGALMSRAVSAGTPFVFINHFANDRLSQPRTRKWLTRASAIGVVSEQGIPGHLQDRYVNLSDAVDTRFFAPENARPIPRPPHPVVLLPARIEASKGHQDMMEAARALVARKVDFTLCFAGAIDSEPLHQELRRSAAAIGLEGRIRFLGEIRAEEIRDWYALSSVVVLPSHSEGLGRVLLEAQAMKRAVVAYDSGGMSKAVLANETGFLVERGNIEALVDRIAFLLANDAERRRMGEGGRKFVCEQFSLSALIGRHEAFYTGALSRTKRNSAVAGR